MRGVVTHVSDLYIITDFTHAKYIWSKVWALAPYLTSSLVSRAYFRLAFYRSLTTTVQYLSYSVRICLIYFKEVTG